MPPTHRTTGNLFGPRRPRAHQLGLGPAVSRRPTHCVACAHPLEGPVCACGVFVCERCDEMTTVNGGEGGVCYRCRS